MGQGPSSLEEFNSDKSVLRVTTDRIPNSSALQKETAIPLGVIVKPFGDPITVSYSTISSSLYVLG